MRKFYLKISKTPKFLNFRILYDFDTKTRLFMDIRSFSTNSDDKVKKKIGCYTGI